MRARGKRYFECALFPALVSASCFLAAAQSPISKSPQKSDPIPTVSAARLGPQADETFELDISERRFTKTDFEASTSVDTEGDSRGVNVRIGVSLNAGSISVFLRNVHGNVRFRGTLDRILEVIGRRAASSPEVR
jgi:hypothetical protein